MDIKEFFKEHKKVALAFSGGVDSAVLLALATKYAKDVKAYFVKTAFQPLFELEDAQQIAALTGAEFEIIRLNILADVAVTANPENRCYFCKKRIFGAIISKAHDDGYDFILDGTNASDDISDRPGFAALKELGVLSPLRDCGYTKADIRLTAEELKLPVAHKPSYACLATRLPYGTPITQEALEKTERNEAYLRSLGFVNFRIRYVDSSARLELSRADFELIFKKKDKIFSFLSKDYENVFLNLRERKDE